ncbi:hypothetical protein KUTeg_003793 [Tegillarca granosa]|uniref:Uncharacterized protein n=1 Tax=Tegillarca granosa TaxID=220873 RepID=A0ABQ9FRX8_TEGGR|nr:hypothetical protein KUTeg_003793 [Tegillarca granosa]
MLKHIEEGFVLTIIQLRVLTPVESLSDACNPCGPPILYPIWTISWLLFHISWMLFEAADSDLGGNWFTFLTNWGFVSIVIMQCVDTAITIYVHLKRRDIVQGCCNKMTWFIKLHWVLFNIANALAMVITLAYWILLPANTSPRSINKHALNYGFVIVNLCFSAKPVRVYHMYQPVIFAVVYLFFTGIYQAAGGGAIYTVLDWNKPGSAMAVCIPIAFIGVPLSHLFFFALHKIRNLVSNMCGCARGSKKIGPLHKTESKEMFARDHNEHLRSTPHSVNTPTLITLSSASLTPEPQTVRPGGNHLEPTPEEEL